MSFFRRNFVLTCLLAVGLIAAGGIIHAQQDNGDKGFSLQVAPSPIAETIVPGTTQTTELNIRNTGTQAETLKMGLQSFKFNQESGEVELLDEEPADVKDWVKFASPVFSVNSGAVFNQKINITTPADAGFAYYFAITIKRAEQPAPASGQQALEGSVAVFTLLSVDRPDAKRSYEIVEFSSKKRVYEYLPAEFSLTIKNTGNTIVRPAGSIFIQRTSGSNNPVSVLPANPNGSFILPETYRVLSIVWQEGFPVFEPVKDAENVNPEKKLNWDFSKAGKFRFGKYVAKVIAIYNDGQRDIPVQAEVSFWVVPWKMMLVFLAVASLIVIGLVSIVKGLLNVNRRRGEKAAPGKSSESEDGKDT